LGHLALGEFLWVGEASLPQRAPWMRPQEPEVCVRFPVESLIARRTFVFARAGFGKSNLVKLLFSELYRHSPTVESRFGRQAPVGTLIFDRDGEYFWPDHKGRPGLADVPHLQDKLVVFTTRKGPSPFYDSFVAGPVKLDIRRLPPEMVVGIALTPERQDQQNVRKLKGLSRSEWERLVDLVHREGNRAPLEEVSKILHLDKTSEVEAIAARSNMYTIVKMLHHPQSRLLDHLLKSLEKGKLCVVDLSMVSGEVALVLSGLILQHVFHKNQEEFTTREAKTIPVIAVLEEAQSVLGSGVASHSPYVAWVKEGRKYDLGAVLITQQPGSISRELLSQGDNWFIFHLLSAGDLKAVKEANAHFGDDLLSSLLNEPIPGHGIFWSSVSGKAYPLPLRVLSYEDRYRVMDPHFQKEATATFARELKASPAPKAEEEDPAVEDEEGSPEDPGEGPEGDYLKEVYDRVLREVGKGDGPLVEQVRQYGRWGIFWAGVASAVKAAMPDDVEPNNSMVNDLVAKTMDHYFGKQRWRPERDEENRLRIHFEADALEAFLQRYAREP
ncbi:MAG: DUF87 domain-containing protein, partial [Bacillota bacterium]|nr:DUF87 domain-containing protein [Bacillota bacterium]